MAIEENLLNGTNRQTVLTFPNNEYADITSGFHSGSISIERVLCSEHNIHIGECNSDKFECILENVSDITGLKIQVKQVINEDEIILFTGYVDSAKLVTHKNYRKIIAYDELYYVADRNVATWYNNLFSNTSVVTMSAFRTSLLDYAGLTYDNVTLVNDDISIKKTIDTKSLRFDDVIRLVCEANACFGHMSNDGTFKFVYLSQGTTYDMTGNYRNADTEFEEYECATITGVSVADEDESAYLVGTDDNTYNISDNWLLWNLGSQKNDAVTNIFLELNQYFYTPANCKLIFAYPLINMGDTVTIDDVSFYCLNTTLNGVQMFTQSIKADGDEYLNGSTSDNINSQIQGIKTKLNNLANESTSSYFVQIYADNDIATVSAGESITLSAKVIDIEGHDCTDDFPEDCFRWIRQSGNIEADSAFNIQKIKGTELEVEYEDNIASVTYICEVSITANGDTTIASSTKTYIATDTYYNIVFYDNKFVGGTDLSDEYGVKETAYIEDSTSEWTNKGLHNADETGKYALVRVLGNDLVGFGYDTQTMQYWGTDNGTDNNVTYLDFAYADNTIFRLSENEGTYSIHSMSDVVTEDTLIFSTTDKIKSWVTDGTNHIVLLDDNKIYKVATSTTLTLLTSTLSTSGATKLAINDTYVCCIGSQGRIMYCPLSNLNNWTMKNAGYSSDLIDVFAYGSYFYIINDKGKVYKGNTKYTAIDQFDENPISIQIIDIYMIVTYKGRIALKVENIALNFEKYDSHLGNETTTGTHEIKKMVKFQDKYVYLINTGTLCYKTDITDDTFTVVSNVPFEERTDIEVSEDGNTLYLLGNIYRDSYDQNYISYTTDLANWSGLLDTQSTSGTSTLNSVLGNYYPTCLYSMARVGGYLFVAYGYVTTSPANMPVGKVDIENQTVTVMTNVYQRGAYIGGYNGVLGLGRYTNSSYSYADFSTNLTSFNITPSTGADYFQYTPSSTFSPHEDGLLYMGSYRGYYVTYFDLVRNDGTYTVYRPAYKGTEIEIASVQYANGTFILFSVDGYVYASTNGQYWHRVMYMEEMKVSNNNTGANRIIYAGNIDGRLIVQIQVYADNTYSRVMYVGGAE